MTDSTQDNPPPSRVAPPSERLLGVVIGDRYVLRREAGRGGVAAVYVADHLFTGRTVAIKMLLPDLARRGDARARLLREARNLGRVDHGNVVELLDAGIASSGPYVVMERLRGRSLEGLVAARGQLPFATRFVSRASPVGRSPRCMPRGSSTATSSPATCSSCDVPTVRSR